MMGALMVLAGLGWLAFLSAAFASHGSAYIAFLGVSAEGSLMLWLLVFGANVRRCGE